LSQENDGRYWNSSSYLKKQSPPLEKNSGAIFVFGGQKRLLNDIAQLLRSQRGPEVYGPKFVEWAGGTGSLSQGGMVGRHTYPHVP